MNYKMPVICQFRTGSSKGSDFFSRHTQNKILLPLRVVFFFKKKTPPEQNASSCWDSHWFNDFYDTMQNCSTIILKHHKNIFNLTFLQSLLLEPPASTLILCSKSQSSCIAMVEVMINHFVLVQMKKKKVKVMIAPLTLSPLNRPYLVFYSV